jgi:hypothetical protein
MLKTLTFSAAAAFLLILTACHKHNDGNGNGSSSLIGTWNFGYIKLNAQESLEEVGLGQDIKQVVFAKFTTTQNTGTVTFTPDSLQSNGVGFTYAYNSVAYQYNNGILSPDSTVTPVNLSNPPTTSSSKYQLIGKDSIYFPGGGLIPDLGTLGGGAAVTPASGGHYVIAGDSLTITSIVNQVSTQSAGPVVETQTLAGTAIIVMKK